MSRRPLSRMEGDIDWHLHLEGPRLRRRPNTGCKLGDPRKRRQLVSQFLSRSTLHGVNHAVFGKRTTSPIKWGFRPIVVFCMVMTVLSVVFLSLDAFRKESTYVASTFKSGDVGPEEDPHFPRYPRITICREPPFDRRSNSSEEALLEYAYLSLGYPFFSLPPEERTLLIESVILGPENTPGFGELQDRLQRLKSEYDVMVEAQPDFNLTHFILNNSVPCESMFSKCVTYLFNMPCCRLFHPVLTALGPCQTMVPPHFFHLLERQSRDVDFAFIIDLQTVPRRDEALDEGYLLLISDPRDNELFISESDAHPVINGFENIFKVRLTKTSRSYLFTPWHEFWSECPALPPEIDSGDGERFFKTACEKKVMGRLLRQSSGCRSVLEHDDGNGTKQCDPVDIYDKFMQEAINKGMFSEGITCQHPCIEYNYETEVNFVKIGQKNTTRLVFRYDGSTYTYYEYRKTTMSGFIGQIGGVMGLYIGASIITCLEVIGFINHWIYYRLMPARQTPINARRKSHRLTGKLTDF